MTCYEFLSFDNPEDNFARWPHVRLTTPQKPVRRVVAKTESILLQVSSSVVWRIGIDRRTTVYNIEELKEFSRVILLGAVLI